MDNLIGLPSTKDKDLFFSGNGIDRVTIETGENGFSIHIYGVGDIDAKMIVCTCNEDVVRVIKGIYGERL